MIARDVHSKARAVDVMGSRCVKGGRKEQNMFKDRKLNHASLLGMEREWNSGITPIGKEGKR